MKNFMLSVAFLLIGTFGFASNNNNGDDKKKKESPKTEVVNEAKVNVNEVKTTDEEAIRCKVSISAAGVTLNYSCWFCNCENLTNQMLLDFANLVNN